MAYFLLAGQLPFEYNGDAQDMENIVHARYNFNGKIWADVSDEGLGFLMT